MIFSDRSLHDMAKIKPQNEAEFLEVSGVGQAKMQKYGATMIQVIKSFQLLLIEKLVTFILAYLFFLIYNRGNKRKED